MNIRTILAPAAVPAFAIGMTYVLVKFLGPQQSASHPPMAWECQDGIQAGASGDEGWIEASGAAQEADYRMDGLHHQWRWNGRRSIFHIGPDRRGIFYDQRQAIRIGRRTATPKSFETLCEPVEGNAP